MNESRKTIENLFKTHHRELCGFAYSMVKDRDAARDIVQEVFLKLWNNKERITFGDQIKGYLFRATARTALNYLRSYKRVVRLDDVVTQHLTAHHGTETMAYRELEQRIEKAVERLPPRCKAVFVLSREQGLSYQEIADHLDLSVKTVENQMGLALSKIREYVRPFLPWAIWILIILTGLIVMSR